MPRTDFLRRLRAGAIALLACSWLFPAIATAAIDPDDLLLEACFSAIKFLPQRVPRDGHRIEMEHGL